ncbi:unnamed protein product [Protopolystoma xenopodis]|uniref:Uncharacterized protein n=1 Tax=Protopolystoma xenopodis TaxID=117903 RepID=A0A448WMD1_9PLAT|nr:unnamed protein product [Protopolystoma xenopodis]
MKANPVSSVGLLLQLSKTSASRFYAPFGGFDSKHDYKDNLDSVPEASYCWQQHGGIGFPWGLDIRQLLGPSNKDSDMLARMPTEAKGSHNRVVLESIS